MAPYSKLKPLDVVEVIGKRGTKEPFSIRLQKGQYLNIEIEQLEQLKQINETYKSIYKKGVEPLEQIEIVGRGGVAGYRPFLLKGYRGRYLCIGVEDFKQLMEINVTYGKLLEEVRKQEPAKKRRAEKPKIKEIERKRRLEDKRKREFEEKRKAEVLRQKETEIKKRVDGRYVYCVIPSKEERKSFGNIGIEPNTEVYTINYKDIAAVVSNVPMGEYTPTEDYTIGHERGARRVLEDCSMVPAAFGQVFKNEKILRTVMRKAYKPLGETLKLVDNKIELGVKVVILKQLAESLDEKKRSELKKAASKIFNVLDKKAEQSATGRLFSDRLVLNTSFLVDRDKMDEFSKEVGKLGKKYNDLKIKYSGPWPPYSFVYINIGAKGIEVGKKEVR